MNKPDTDLESGQIVVRANRLEIENTSYFPLTWSYTQVIRQLVDIGAFAEKEVIQ